MIRINDLNSWILQWGYDRGITVNGKTIGQAIKTLEETTELLDAVNRDNDKEIQDAIGDVYVTLMMICGIKGFNMQDCIKHAYDEIKDRKGYLREDGVFVKDDKQGRLDI